MSCAIQPWLSVHHSKQALEFYKQAFGAKETYLLATGVENVIARLSVEGAEFWIADESAENPSPLTLNAGTVRMILITQDPETIFNRAINSGAKQIFPIAEEHGWRLGRIIDPFGHHWEIGHPVES